MEVKVLTRKRGEYIFTTDMNGEWKLFRHHRSHYLLICPVEIKKFHPMEFVAQRYDPFQKKEESFVNIKSSWVMKIWVDGQPVKSFTVGE